MWFCVLDTIHHTAYNKLQSKLPQWQNVSWSLGVSSQPGEHLAVPETSMWTPGNSSIKLGSANYHLGSTNAKRLSMLYHSRAGWEKHYLLWECCWCAWKSYLLLIVQRFLKLMYSVCILINMSMYLYSYPAAQRISGFPAASIWEAIRCVPEEDDPVTSAIDSYAIIKRSYRIIWRPKSRERTDPKGGDHQAGLATRLEVTIWVSAV